MTAHPILLQKKYGRVVSLYAEKNNKTLSQALDDFYHSTVYFLMKNGISDMHCMSDDYLADSLIDEIQTKTD